MKNLSFWISIEIDVLFKVVSCYVMISVEDSSTTCYVFNNLFLADLHQSRVTNASKVMLKFCIIQFCSEIV